jgi:ATP adenylyltransferase
MEQIWAPWRMTYIRREEKDPGCVFCLSHDAKDDERRLVLLRGEHSFVIMNKYPYTNGHLMVSPFRHTADLSELTDEESLEMHRLLVLSQQILLETMAPHGFNIGINLGVAAGAGIADHLHMHIVPRWSGDTNFMPVFSEVRIIPQHLEETWGHLRKLFAQRHP